MNKFVPLNPLQAAVMTRLTTTPAVTSLCPSIFDAVPAKQSYPYMVYRDPMVGNDRTFGQGGHSGIFHVDIFTQDGATSRSGVGTKGTKQGLDIAEQAVTALVDPCDGSGFTPITVEGHDLVDLDAESVDSMLENDGVTRKTTIMFSFLLETQ